MGELDLKEHFSSTSSPTKARTLGLALISRERALQTPDGAGTRGKDSFLVNCEVQNYPQIARCVRVRQNSLPRQSLPPHSEICRKAENFPVPFSVGLEPAPNKVPG